MPEMKVTFEISCATCGYGLCGQVSSHYPNKIEVKACPICVERAKVEADGNHVDMTKEWP